MTERWCCMLLVISTVSCQRGSPTTAQRSPPETTPATKEADDPRVHCPPDAHQERTSIGDVECRDKDGELHGPSVSFYPSGQKLEERTYVHGSYEGLRRVWFESGALRVEEHRRVGQLHGLRRDWHENGQLAFEALSACDEPIGLMRWWDESGKLTDERHFGTVVRGCPMDDLPVQPSRPEPRTRQGGSHGKR